MDDVGGVIYESGSLTVGAPGQGLQSNPARARARKVAILGFGRTVRECPWNDQTWELWAMNGFWRAAAKDFGITATEDRYSLWLDMHTVAFTRDYGKRAGFGDAQERWLEQPHPFPIYMLDTDPAFPSVLRYPIEEVIARTGRDYMTSTVAFALAYAMTQPDIAEIGLWGVDLVHDTEYEEQRPCAEYWIGRLESAGVVVTTHAQSAILRQRYRYGYETPSKLADDLKEALRAQGQGLEDAITKNTAAMDSLRVQLHTDDGALQAVREVLNRIETWQRGGRA